MRTCTRCLKEQPSDQFPMRLRLGVRQPHTRCKACLNELAKAWKDRNKDKVAASHATWYRSEKGRTYRTRDPRRALLVAARSRAKQRGIPFDLGMDDIAVPDRCPILGLPLKIHVGSKGGRPDSPSLDRLIPSKGYVRGNVRVISHLANSMKGSATPEQLVTFAHYVLTEHVR